MANFTLIAYKPDSSDYCRGCHMASYSSGIEVSTQLTREELIKKWADLAATKLECNEAGYEITVLAILNGHTLCLKDEINGSIGSIEIPDEIYYGEESEVAQADFREIEGAVQIRTTEIIKAREEEIQRKADAERLRQMEQNRQRDLAELARLKATYGG